MKAVIIADGFETRISKKSHLSFLLNICSMSRYMYWELGFLLKSGTDNAV